MLVQKAIAFSACGRVNCFLQVCPILCVDLYIYSDSVGVDGNEIEKPDWVRRM